MQKYVAYKVKTASLFGNFSGTGAGKTLSAILASRVVNSRMILIVCPNDVADQWKTHIKQAFPEDSTIVTDRKGFTKVIRISRHMKWLYVVCCHWGLNNIFL